MNYDTLLCVLSLAFDAKAPLFIWSHTGLGKSDTVRLFANKKKLGFVDYRLSQIEAAELRGLPDRQDGMTVYYPPADLPSGDMKWEDYEKGLAAETTDFAKMKYEVKNLRRVENGILFLDELPRAADDVQQAVFQLVRDRRIGQYVLPPGWAIVCAGNFLDGYQQSGFKDEAFINRFAHIQIHASAELMDGWISYMNEKHSSDIATQIIQCVSQDMKYLYGAREGNLGFNIQPSPRSWDLAARILALTSEKNLYGERAVEAMLCGILGDSVARTFRTVALPVTPKQLVSDGLKAHMNTLKEIKENRGQSQGLMWGMLSYCRKNTDVKVIERAIEYAKWLLNECDTDLAVAFCKMMLGHSDKSNINMLRNGLLMNPKVLQMFKDIRTESGRNKERTFGDLLSESPELNEMMRSATFQK